MASPSPPVVVSRASQWQVWSFKGKTWCCGYEDCCCFTIDFHRQTWEMYMVVIGTADFSFPTGFIPLNDLACWINMLSVWSGCGDLRFRFLSIISKVQSSYVFPLRDQMHHFPGPFSQGFAYPSFATLEIPCANESPGIPSLWFGDLCSLRLWWFILCVHVIKPHKPKVSGWTLSRCVHFVRRFTFDLSVWARPIQTSAGHKGEGENSLSALIICLEQCRTQSIICTVTVLDWT